MDVQEIMRILITKTQTMLYRVFGVVTIVQALSSVVAVLTVTLDP